jgi:large subunit ribosomal protein L33
MARGDVRIQVRLVSTTGTGTVYLTSKNKRSTPGRLELRKYDKRVRRHVLFREAR